MAAAFYIGHIFPIVLSKDMWLLIMMGYIFVASIAPVWILLQPRDYLNSFLLYPVSYTHLDVYKRQWLARSLALKNTSMMTLP